MRAWDMGAKYFQVLLICIKTLAQRPRLSMSPASS
jgi:hypothetical protein